MAATLASLLTCSLGMLGATAWRLCMVGWVDMRVYVNNDLIDVVDQTSPPTLGVVMVPGTNFVVGLLQRNSQKKTTLKN